MDKSLQNYIHSEELCNKSDHILLAISGGVDSVVLLHILHKLGYKIAVAHCNFALREDASDADEQFVKMLTEKYNVPLYCQRFETMAYAKEKKLSIEMAARELRYQWFNTLLKKEGYDYIATGHHMNDSIETVLLNLCRGTGISGLTGIKAKNKKVIRPLLFTSRERIESYAKDNQLNYRYDASNDSMKYMRNIVRHQVIPAMRKINPSFDAVMERNIQNFEKSSKLYFDQITQIEQRLVKHNNDSFSIDTAILNKLKHKEVVLFELLQPYGYNYALIDSIFKSIPNSIGNLFYSAHYQLLVDRNKLIIEKIEDQSFKKNRIEDFEQLKTFFKKVKIVTIDSFKLEKEPAIACLDFEKIKFPLSIEKWNDGDSFYPLGMKHKKKISDFLIDSKISRFDKKRTKLLKSDKEIVWVINHRIDNRYKVSDTTRSVLILYY